jgi:hypothetical protein
LKKRNGKHTQQQHPAFTGFFVVVLRAFATLYIAGNCLGAVSIVDKRRGRREEKESVSTNVVKH